METITNKFTSLLKSQPQPHRHAPGGTGELPIYQPIRGSSARSTSSSRSRRSDSTGESSHSRVHTAPGSPQLSRQSAASHEFSSSSETLDCLGGADIIGPISPSPPGPRSSSQSFRFPMKLPALKRFLSDFTLGFADGLTVPFALTAGLSSLGETKTVIYAGMAEICAGSISMGIGGYLAAKGERTPNDDMDLDSSSNDEALEDEKMPLQKTGDELETETVLLNPETERIASYLSPLHLPPYLRDQALAHARLSSLPITNTHLSNTSATGTPEDESPLEPEPPSAILSGFSISLGYLLGGILPLFPYFFVDKVTDGLAWSFCVCVLALFFFGFGKAYALGGGECDNSASANTKKNTPVTGKWKRMKRSIWEGVQMVVLGSIAAGAAVLCVSAFEKLT